MRHDLCAFSYVRRSKIQIPTAGFEYAGVSKPTWCGGAAAAASASTTGGGTAASSPRSSDAWRGNSACCNAVVVAICIVLVEFGGGARVAQQRPESDALSPWRPQRTRRARIESDQPLVNLPRPTTQQRTLKEARCRRCARTARRSTRASVSARRRRGAGAARARRHTTARCA